MVFGPRPPRQSRQNGRYNPEKDRKSNRKYEKRSRELEKRLEEEENAIEKTIYPHKYDDLKPHEKVELDRPEKPATWFQKQQAMTPSRSYAKVEKTEEKEMA
jgi:hypothetical protein